MKTEQEHSLVNALNDLGLVRNKIRTYSDYDNFLIERAVKGPIPMNGGYSKALVDQLLSFGRVGPAQSLTANTSVYSPAGLIGMGSGGVITITVPAAPVSGVDDGKLALFTVDTAHAHVVSFTGATLFSVGVAKTTSTSGALIGGFLLVVSRLVHYIVLASADQTFA